VNIMTRSLPSARDTFAALELRLWTTDTVPHEELCARFLAVRHAAPHTVPRPPRLVAVPVEIGHQPLRRFEVSLPYRVVGGRVAR
jgi:hypothetical protein